MSTHTDPAPRHASPAEPTIEADADSPSADEPASDRSDDGHAAAAMFDTGSTVRLPNTIDDENAYLG